MAPGDAQRAFAQAAAEDGIALAGQSFDWLCEQGHVGLERVAKLRRDPALVGPVTAAVRHLGAIYDRLGGDLSVLSASRENLLLPVELVHAPTGTLVEVDESAHFTSFRLAALELYPADALLDFDLEEYKELCRTWCSSTDALSRGLAAKGFGFGGVQRERAYHDALRDLATPAMGHPPLVRIAAPDGDGAAAYRSPAARAAPGASAVRLGDGDVDRRAAPAADPDLLRHLYRVHIRGEHVAALDADVVVGSVAAEDGPVSVLLDRGAAVERHLTLANPSHGDGGHRRRGMLPVVLMRPVDRAELAGEVLDQRVQHACDDPLAHRRRLARDPRGGVDGAAAVREREHDVRVRVSLAARLSRPDGNPTRWAVASCSTTSTVPVNLSPIAPILMSICALTDSGPVLSRTLAPSTHGTTRSRSTIAAKLSSSGLAVEKGCSSDDGDGVATLP